MTITEIDYCPLTGDKPYSGYRYGVYGDCPECGAVLVPRHAWDDAAERCGVVLQCINKSGGRCDYRRGGPS